MDMLLWILAIVIALILGAVGTWLFLRRQRSEHLRDRFGPEYNRATATHRDRRRAEDELEAREQRVDRFQLGPLTADEEQQFTATWRKVQARFVDAPDEAIGDADLLIQEVMQTRGYPVGDFEQRAADLSVNHPQVVQRYRAARRIAVANQRGQASTEELRQAMQLYHDLFDDLVGEHVAARSDPSAPADRHVTRVSRDTRPRTN